MLRHFATGGLAWALVGLGTAHAQTVGPAEPVAGVSGRVVALDAVGERWAVVFDDGSVRVHVGGTIDRLLRPPAVLGQTSDDAVLRVEGLLDEAGEGEGLGLDAAPEFEEPDPDLAAEGEEPEVEVADADVVDDTSDRLEELLQGEGSLEAGDRGAGEGLVRWGRGPRIAVSRSDGVWTSEDGGERWSRWSRTPASALADDGTRWAAVLEDGRVQVGAVRERIALGPMFLEVMDLAASDGTIWAATDLGLWTWSEAGGWTPVGTDLDPLREVVADPGWEGGLWVRGPQGIRRTDDGGLTWRSLDGGPRAGHLAWGGPAPGGALLVTGDGTWRHAEGGWIRDGRRLDLGVVTEAGLFAVVGGQLLAPPAGIVAGAEVLPEWIALGDLMGAALHRRDLRAPAWAGRVVYSIVPTVDVGARWVQSTDTDYLPFTTAGTRGTTTVGVRLTWTPMGFGSTSPTVQQAEEELELRTDSDDLGIVTGGTLGVSPAARVTHGLNAYRQVVADRVRDLVEARNALFFERAALPAGDLREAVAWELRRTELEARIDALTHGAVSAWNLDHP